ncbi:hypothetical protein WJX73_006576 [Symbiochloris irregularis]|uniref:Pullulanase n=1 Tax=Symbiochloris irregularis TaxID=706552 RepID=A0AAW1NWV7_9CHLO
MVHNLATQPLARSFRDTQIASAGGRFMVLAQSTSSEQTAVLQAQGTTLRVAYIRPDQSYEGWGLHVWGDVKQETVWAEPLKPSRSDDGALHWDVELIPDQSKNNFDHWVGFIIHKGDEKDAGGDVLKVGKQERELFFVAGRKAPFYERPDLAALPPGDLTKAAAHWLTDNLLGWRIAPTGDSGAARLFKLHWSHSAGLHISGTGVEGSDGQIDLQVPGGDLAAHGGGEALKKFPHLDGCTALNLPASALDQIPRLITAQLALSAVEQDGTPVDGTGVQLQGVLDHSFLYPGRWGNWLHDDGSRLGICVWAPTAQEVTLRLWEGPRGGQATEIPMVRGSQGEWAAEGPAEWLWRYYTYRVRVFSHWSNQVETFEVTDPCSRSLAADGARTQIAVMDDPSVTPQLWHTEERPQPLPWTDTSVYELHIRDFSASDNTVPGTHRGKYIAFTEPHSLGVNHLKTLQAAGLTHVHLLPSFDFGSVPERPEDQQVISGDLSRLPPDSEEQQAAVSAIAAEDAFNWGYDPVHWSTPEGSYASDPDGPTRILEYRLMVQALHRMGLRVIFDTVYNHTFHSGTDGVHSQYAVFDKLVPGYYHRRTEQGDLCTSACCNNTAPEHAMCERLIIEDCVHWAQHYKIDGFRFDIMGHLMLSTMTKIQAALSKLTVKEHGVDGSKIYIYGEGWDFGEVSCNQRGRNASQLNLAGTGLGSFNDRFRDSIVGGSPFGPIQFQGFASGLATQPSAFTKDGMSREKQLQLLLEYTDLIKLGLAGNLRSYEIQDAKGSSKKGLQLRYGVQPAGYASEPWETVNYTSCHDGEILFDQLMLKSAEEASLSDRIRAHRLALGLVAVSQGVAFFHAGDHILRSKSLDRDSYNSGDWFNRLDYTLHENNFGVGLPPAAKNRESWDWKRRLLADPQLKPGMQAIQESQEVFLELLRIRYSTPLLRLPCAHHIHNQLTFLNTGPDQVAGLIVMQVTSADVLGVDGTSDPEYARLVVVVNARPASCAGPLPDGAERLELHPILANSADPAMRGAHADRHEGAITIPARTVAVFVERR